MTTEATFLTLTFTWIRHLPICLLLVDFRYLWSLSFGNAIAKLDTLGLNLGG